MIEEIVDAEFTESTAIERAPVADLFQAGDPSAVVARATETAKALKDVVKSQGLIANIQGKEHPQVEAWTLLGSMLGVFPVVVWTKPLDDSQSPWGYEARVEARTRSGEVVGAAEAMCDRGERSWAKRDDYALRSMAQTRATSKALRGPLGFVMQLAGYNPTPAEELSEGTPQLNSTGETPRPVAAPVSPPSTSATVPSQSSGSDAHGEGATGPDTNTPGPLPLSGSKAEGGHPAPSAPGVPPPNHPENHVYNRTSGKCVISGCKAVKAA